MIRTKDYTTVMSTLLKPDSVGRFHLQKKVVRKGTILRTYNPVLARFYNDMFQEDFPVICLYEGTTIWMSDTPMEQEGLRIPVKFAHGNVLISGLGIGLFPTLITNKKRVQSIDIVELNQEVIDLVFRKIETSKMRVIKGDVLQYLNTTDKRYDFIYIDIWGGIIQPIQEIDKVSKIAKRCLEPGGIVFCWLQELYERVKEKLPKEPMIASSTPGIKEPCLICEKRFRNDYAGLCMDCADMLGVSEIFLSKNPKYQSRDNISNEVKQNEQERN